MEVYIFKKEDIDDSNTVLYENDIQPMIIIGYQNEEAGKVDAIIYANNLTSDTVISILQSALRKFKHIQNHLPF